MRKIVATLIIIMFISGCAFAFAEIDPAVTWLSNDVDALQALYQAGMLRTNIDFIPLTHDNVIYFIKNEKLNYQPFMIPAYSKYAFAASLGTIAKGKIVGYPIENITLTFAYDGEYKLISAKVDLMDANYEVLKERLIKLYGDGELKAIEDEGIEAITWSADSDSGVLLYTESYGDEYTLLYGRFDAEEILADCLVSPDK